MALAAESKGDEAVTLEECQQLPPEGQDHFGRCAECGEMYDRRSLDEVLFYCVDHRPRVDIQYAGWEKTVSTC